MADVIITLKIMPENPETNLKELEEKAKLEIENFGGEVGKVEIEPVAFGIKALKLIFVIEEEKGSTEELEKNIQEINGVNSVEAVDVRRAIG